MVDTTQSLIERKINGNILLKSSLNAVHSAGVETVASSLCHQSGVMFPQEGRTFLDQVTHKVIHGATAAGTSVFMGNPDAALACGLGAIVGEMAIESLDAMDQKPTKSMTPQERQTIEKVNAQKELDQKTNTSLFKMAIKKRDIANLAAALFLTLTTPDHLVAEAYQAAQRAMDFNHDVSSLRAKDQEREEEDAEEKKRALRLQLERENVHSPRTIDAMIAVAENEQYKDYVPHISRGVDDEFSLYENPEDVAKIAYVEKQAELAQTYLEKQARGQTLTEYETRVVRDHTYFMQGEMTHFAQTGIRGTAIAATLLQPEMAGPIWKVAEGINGALDGLNGCHYM